MKVHEYQALSILKKFGVSIPDFFVASNMEEVTSILKTLKVDEVCLRGQVHIRAYGDSSSHIYRKVKGREQILLAADEIFSFHITNKEALQNYSVVHQIMIFAPIAYEREYSLSIQIDDKELNASILLRKTLDEISLKVMIPLDGKLSDHDMKRLCAYMQLEGQNEDVANHFFTSLIHAFHASDACSLEIDSLVFTHDHKLVPRSVHLSIDDNALFRQNEFKAFYDPSQLSTYAAMAKAMGIPYMEMEGNISILANGKGLAMATADAVCYYGGMPANVLDIGDVVKKESIANGFKILLRNENIKCLLINIVDGILDCLEIAQGISQAATELQVKTHKKYKKLPVIVRMEGMKADNAKYFLNQVGFNLKMANSLKDGAKKSVIGAGIL